MAEAELEAPWDEDDILNRGDEPNVPQAWRNVKLLTKGGTTFDNVYIQYIDG